MMNTNANTNNMNNTNNKDNNKSPKKLDKVEKQIDEIHTSIKKYSIWQSIWQNISATTDSSKAIAWFIIVFSVLWMSYLIVFGGNHIKPEPPLLGYIFYTIWMLLGIAGALLGIKETKNKNLMIKND